MRGNLLNSIRSFIALMGILMFVNLGTLYGQFDISYPKQARSLTTCRGADSLFVRLDATQASTNGLVTINLPPGTTYIPGSVQKISGSIVSISEQNIGNLNQPVFGIGTVVLGDFIVFRIAREAADCAARQFVINGGVMKDSIVVASSAGTVREESPTVNSYNLRYASLSLTGEGAVGGAVGSTVMRNVMITNGGFGQLGEFTFIITENALGLHTTKLETVGGTLIPPISDNTSGGIRTLTYTIISALIMQYGNLDGYMDNGEVVVLKRTYKILTCTIPSAYEVTWGCGSEICQDLTLTQQTNTGNGTPKVNWKKSTAVQLTNMCKDIIYDYEFKNEGSESAPGAGMAFDIDFLAGMNSSGSGLTHNNLISDILGVYVDGINVTSCITCPEGVRGDLSLLTSAHYGLIDADGDGKFDDLPVGASFTIRIVMKWNCQATCGINHSTGSMKVTTDYQNQCDITVNRSVKNTAPSETLYQSTGLGIEGPTDVNNNDVFSLNVCQAYVESLPDNSSFYDCPTNDLVLQIAVPKGFTPNLSSAMFMGASAVAQFANDTVYIHGNASTGSGAYVCYSIDFTFLCSTYNPPPDFHMTIKYVCDQACGCMEKWNCGTWTPRVHCSSGPCAEGGLTTRRTTVQRITMGYTDNTGTTRVNPNSVPYEIKRRALPCDSLLFSFYSEQLDGTSGGASHTWDNAHLHIQYDQLGGGNLLDFVSATARIYDVSAGTYTDCILPTPVATIVGGKHIFEYDMTSCLTGNLEPGDSVNVFAKAVVLDNPSMDKIPMLAPGLMVYHYNQVGALKAHCADFSVDVYLHNYKLKNNGTSGTISSSGCSISTIYHQINTGVTYDQYPQEYRSEGRLDSITFELGNSGILEPAHTHTLRATNNVSGVTTVMLGAPTYTYGTKHTWVNPGTWPIGDELSSSYTYRMDIKILTSCTSQNGPYATKFYFEDNHYAYDAGCKLPQELAATGNVNLSFPNHKITNQSGVAPADSEIKWQVQIQNTSNTPSAYIWVAIPNGNGSLQVTNVKLLPSMTNLTLLPYANGLWAKVQTSLTGGGVIDLEVTASLTTCADDSLQVLMGWDCTGYPVDPNSGSCEVKSVWLKVKPVSSEVQLILDEEPTAPVPACTPTPIHYELLINSAQPASLRDVKFAINMASGLQLSGNVEFEYPEGSGHWEALTNQGNSQYLLFDVMTHSQIPPSGIPGTFGTLLLPPRQVRVRFDAQVNCDFIPGSNFYFEVFANNFCGAPAVGNGIRVTSSAIQVIGFTYPYKVQITTQTDKTSVNCQDEATMTVDHYIFGVGQTEADDYVEIKFPSGLGFSGTLTCITNCPTVQSYTNNMDGTSTLILAIPAGLSATDHVKYAIGVNAENSLTCDLDDSKIRITSFAVVDGFLCGNMQCGDISYPIVRDSIKITPLLSEVAFNAANVNTCSRYDGSIKIRGSAKMARNNLALNESVEIQVFCLDNLGNPIGAPVGSLAFNGPLAIGANLNFDFSVTGCNPSNGIMLIGVGSCVCDTSELIMPVGTSDFDTVSVSTACLDGQNSYIITMVVSGGIAPYSVVGTGAPGSWTGTTWTSAPVLGASIYNFFVTDADGCNLILVNGQGAVCCQFNVICPSDTTIDCTSATDTASLGSPIVTSSCGNTIITFVDQIFPINPQHFKIKRTFTIIDDGMDTIECIQQITVQDTTKPVFLEPLPQDTTVNCNSIPQAVTFIDVIDNCSPSNGITVVYSEVRTDGNCLYNYTLTRTWTATDENGNSTTHTQIVAVQDTTKPVFVAPLPQDTTVNCDAVPEPVVISATDNCSIGNGVIIDYSEEYTEGNCPNNYIIARTWVATDDCGNSSSHTQIVTVQDTTKPVFVESLPQDTTVNCDAVPEADILTATDNCSFNDGEIEGITVDYNEEYTEGDCPNNYTLTRTWVATDECNNSTTHTQIVTVQDTTKPVFVEVLPQDTTVNCDAVPEADILTATDNCSYGEGGDVEIEYNEVRTNGNCLYNYTLTRTWVATDECDNSTTYIQIVTVQDTTKPVFVEVLPQNMTVNCDAVPTAVVLTATDNCSTGNGVTVQYSEVRTNGNCPYNYTLTRTWVATDQCANSTTHIQIVTVQDTTKPVFVEVLPQDTTVNCDAVPTAVILTATDNCSTGNGVTIQYSEVRTNGNCPYNYTLTRTWIATDQCANATTHVQIVTVQDTTKPVFVEALPQDTTVNCDAVPAPAVLTATDNCSIINVIYTQVRTDGDCPYNYTLTRTWNATDDCGNSTIHVQIVTVQDTTKPIFVEVLPQDTTVNCDAVPEGAILTATDNCSIGVGVTIDYSEVRTNGNCPYNYILTRTWIATDQCDNATTHIQIVTVQDTTKPVFVEVLPRDTTVNCDAVPDAVILTATDNCSLGAGVTIVYSQVRTNGDCPYNYTLTRTWIATDECGNSTSHVQIVTVQDTTKPTLIINDPVFANAVNGSVTRLQCRSNEEDWELPTLLDSEISVSDNCGTPIFTMTQTVTDGDCTLDGYFKRIAVKIVVTDQCDNVTNLNFTIEVVDTIPPVFNIKPKDATVSCEAQSWTFEIAASDECECTTISYADTKIKGRCPGNFTLNRLYTATDCCGNKSYYTQIITVIDTTGPEMIPVNINFSGISNGDTLTTYCDGKEIPDWLKEAPASLMKANDVCNGAVKVQKEIRLTNADACWLYGYTKLYEVIFSAQDECNNRSEYVVYIQVRDTVAPVVQYLEEVICQDSKVIPPVVTDNCSEIIYNYSDAPVGGICGSNTSYIRTWSFSDACGNTSYATQYVVANDHKAPQMQLIAGPYKGAGNNETIRVDCADFVVPDQATISSWMSVEDKCDIFDVNTKVDVTLGNCRRDGFAKRALLSWTATDKCGNAATFNLTVLLVDNKKPYFLPNATEVKAECENNIPPVRAYDDCSAVKVNVTRTKIPGSCPGNFTLVEKYTAEDACGNTAEFSRRVYVEDKTGPVIFAPDMICEGDSSGYTPYAADYCNNEPVKLSITKGIKTYKCDGGYYYEVYYSAQDACGNSSVKTQRVVVDDHQPPVIVFTDEFKNKYKFDPWNASIEVSCEEYDSLVSAISKDTYIGIKDNCSSEVNIRTEEKSLGTHCDGEFLYKDYLFVWYATDICGNTSSMELKVKMKNNKTPDFSFVPADTTVYCLSVK